MSTAAHTRRLEGKVALITGGAGTIGAEITRRYLAEGARVVITGRNQHKLDAYREQLVRDEGIAPEQIIALAMDGSDGAAVRTGVDALIARLGRVDILVNNAGTAGPRRPLAAIPLGPHERLPPDTETLDQSIGNLLGIAWNLVRAVAPHMPPGGSIINVSTIFARTDYYGRIAYVVPKAALNALSLALADELGPRGIRVNTVYPGPIDSARIRDVFATMDQLKQQPAGSTADGFLGMMRLSRAVEDEPPRRRFPAPLDVANTIVFLGSDESAAFSGQAFEVTHGMRTPAESCTTFVSRPGLRTVDARGKVVLICAGDQVAETLPLADLLRAINATVLLAFRDRAALDHAAAIYREPGHQSLGDMYGRPALLPLPLLLHLDPLDDRSVAEAFQTIRSHVGRIDHAVILPAHGARITPASALAGADDAAVERLLRAEIGGAITLASRLARFWAEQPATEGEMHRVLFISNGDDGHGNRDAAILRAAIEQLARSWRHESQLDAQRAATGPAPAPVWVNQIIRYVNSETANLDFALAWAAKLIASDRAIDEISLLLPERIIAATGVQSPNFGWAESLFGLHLGKVALITGGSGGIGGQIGRLLALSGARVMLAARSAERLAQMRRAIIDEIRDAGYPDPAARVQIAPDCDVADEAQLARLVQQTQAVFGRIDYLINNAGIAGAEEMVIDMPLDCWRHTLQANLISNYSLIRKTAPLMKAQSGGYILNVSSYFGGEKDVAIPYPNRSDYAVSKAGQRAMAEAFARLLGPEIQINAIAPGPVAGDRLRGDDARPGLFLRRARLILENKRLNEIYGALLEAHTTSGRPISDMLALLMRNEVAALAAADLPEPLQRLAAAIGRQQGSTGSAATHLMTPMIAHKLLRRLEVAGALTPVSTAAVVGGGTTVVEHMSLRIVQLLHQLPAPPQPFFLDEQIEREARKVRDGILGMLYLGRMPTEFDVALATVYYLADRNVSGETFHPSGGLNFERTVTAGELFGKARPQRIDMLRGSTIYLIGEHLQRHLLRLAQTYLDDCGAGCVVLLTEREATARALLESLPEQHGSGRLQALATDGALEAAIDRARALWGSPGAVISTPFRPLPTRAITGPRDGPWHDVLSEAEFAALVEDQLTHHFRVAQKVSLLAGATLVLVTPETSARSSPEEFALANFIKTTLHALTATLGAESERTFPHVPVNQVDLTRRARAEEPRNAEEEQEELTRFVHAVLLTSAPLPDPHESRYRSRIYRGNAITV